MARARATVIVEIETSTGGIIRFEHQSTAIIGDNPLWYAVESENVVEESTKRVRDAYVGAFGDVDPSLRPRKR